MWEDTTAPHCAPFTLNILRIVQCHNRVSVGIQCVLRELMEREKEQTWHIVHTIIRMSQTVAGYCVFMKLLQFHILCGFCAPSLHQTKGHCIGRFYAVSLQFWLTFTQIFYGFSFCSWNFFLSSNVNIFCYCSAQCICILYHTFYYLH